MLGAGTAVALRILFAIVIAYLLELPLLKLAGGFLLLWIALHLILQEARVLLDEADDAAYFAELGLPPRPAWSPRHRQFDLMREVFFQDEDVLMSYDAGMAETGTAFIVMELVRG